MSDILTQIQCVKREIERRKWEYPGRVSRGKMAKAYADYELEVMVDVLATLEKVMDNEHS